MTQCVSWGNDTRSERWTYNACHLLLRVIQKLKTILLHLWIRVALWIARNHLKPLRPTTEAQCALVSGSAYYLLSGPVTMIEVTSFFLKHLYELMADDYNPQTVCNQYRPISNIALPSEPTDNTEPNETNAEDCPTTRDQHKLYTAPSETEMVYSEQEINQQIILFLVNNNLPDLICETVIELSFVFLLVASAWIFVVATQMHCQTSYEPENYNSRLLPSLYVCNDQSRLASY